MRDYNKKNGSRPKYFALGCSYMRSVSIYEKTRNTKKDGIYTSFSLLLLSLV